MPAIGVLDTPVPQVEYARENRDKHLRMIAFAKKIVQATQND